MLQSRPILFSSFVKTSIGRCQPREARGLAPIFRRLYPRRYKVSSSMRCFSVRCFAMALPPHRLTAPLRACFTSFQGLMTCRAGTAPRNAMGPSALVWLANWPTCAAKVSRYGLDKEKGGGAGCPIRNHMPNQSFYAFYQLHPMFQTILQHCRDTIYHHFHGL